MRGPAKICAFALVSCVTLALTESCRAPTQMTLRIETIGTLRCPDLKRVMVVTGHDPAEVEERAATKFFAADTRDCEGDTTVGSLVITPDTNRGAVLVVASFDAQKTCDPPLYAGCIVARRAFSFIDHVQAELPISFEISCRDVPCTAISSCRHSNCESSETTCNDDGVCTSPADPTGPGPSGEAGTDAPSDATLSPPDGSATDADDADTSTDAALTGDAYDAGPPGPYLCPMDIGGTPCSLTDRCCKSPGTMFGCLQICPATREADFECVGRRRCGYSSVCCYGASLKKTTCRDTCAPDEIVICQTSSDCPSGHTCSSPGPNFENPTTSFMHCN